MEGVEFSLLQSKKSTDEAIKSSFFISATVFFILWFISLFYFTNDFWTSLMFKNNYSLSVIYFFASLGVFLIFSYISNSKKYEKIFDFLFNADKKYLAYLAALICLSFIFLTVHIVMGENWPTQMARIITQTCDGCPLQAYRLKYFTSSPLSSFFNYFASAIGFAFSTNEVSSMQIFSKIIGVLFVILLYYFSTKYTQKTPIPFFIMNFFTVGILSFYGIAGHVNFIGWIFLLIFFYTSYIHIKHHGGMLLPGIFAALTLLSHLSTVYVLPALLYLSVYDKISFSEGILHIDKKRISKSLITAFVGLAIPYLLFYSYVYFDLSTHGYSISDLGVGDAQSGFVPLTELQRTAMSARYTYFSLPHISDFISWENHLNSFRFMFVLFALLLMLPNKKMREEVLSDNWMVFLLICVCFVTLSVFSWNIPLTPSVVMWETFALTILPFTMLVSHILFTFIKDENLAKRLTLLSVVLVILTLLPWLMLGFSHQEITKASPTLTTTLTTTGFREANNFTQLPQTFSSGKVLVFYFADMAGFKKDGSGKYQTETKLYLQQDDYATKITLYGVDKDLAQVTLDSITKLISDYPGRNFGFIPGEFFISINTSVIPLGHNILRLVITDEVTGATMQRVAEFNLS